ncbi:MAG: purine-nucleoside phosphorylase [Candidatus Caenarcaniphilales bacterium]|nr:purine-nucleoside phosphorylase [Candidatus Caenarcaniphilales bacterium]
MNKVGTSLLQALEVDKNEIVADLAVILGSGIKCTLSFVWSKTIDYSSIAGLPQINVEGHTGQVTFGQLSNGKKLLVFAGRFHLYEGYSVDDVQSIVKSIGYLGVKNVLITNAAGGIDASLKVTDLMLITGIKDYQCDGNLFEERGLLNCLIKEKTSINTPLTNNLRTSRLKEGTYAAVLGPNYETESEINLFRMQKCSAVGMSTNLEVQYCLENNLNVAAISVITNSWFSKSIPTHQEVIQNSQLAQNKFDNLLSDLVQNID